MESKVIRFNLNHKPANEETGRKLINGMAKKLEQGYNKLTVGKNLSPDHWIVSMVDPYKIGPGSKSKFFLDATLKEEKIMVIAGGEEAFAKGSVARNALAEMIKENNSTKAAQPA